jgi:plasmid stabilization system protein ParE
MSTAVWTAHAESELDEVLFHIGVTSGRPMTAERTYLAIRQLADEYARQDAPRHKHPVAPVGWCYFRHKRWLIFYQPRREGIEVMRVIDGSRDLPRQFDRE